LTSLSSLPGQLVGRICGLGHLGGVEQQVDIVIIVETMGLRGGVIDMMQSVKHR